MEGWGKLGIIFFLKSYFNLFFLFVATAQTMWKAKENSMHTLY